MWRLFLDVLSLNTLDTATFWANVLKIIILGLWPSAGKPNFIIASEHQILVVFEISMNLLRILTMYLNFHRWYIWNPRLPMSAIPETRNRIWFASNTFEDLNKYKCDWSVPNHYGLNYISHIVLLFGARTSVSAWHIQDHSNLKLRFRLGIDCREDCKIQKTFFSTSSLSCGRILPPKYL